MTKKNNKKVSQATAFARQVLLASKRKQKAKRRPQTKARKLPKSNRVMALSGIVARSIALPWGHSAIRIPSVASTNRTSVLELNAASQSIALPSSGTQRYMLVASPVAPVWSDYSYAWGRTNALLNVSGPYTVAAGNVNLSNAMSFTIPERFQQFLYTPTGAPNVGVSASPYMAPLGRAGSSDWIYVPAGDRVALCVIANQPAGVPTANNSFYGDCELFVAGDYRALQVTFNPRLAGYSGSGANEAMWSAELVPSENTWLRWRNVDPNSANAFITAVAGDLYVTTRIIVAEAASNLFGVFVPVLRTRFMPFPPSTYLEGEISIYSAARVTALSILLSNTTAYLNQEGSVYCGRLDTGKFDVFNADAVSLSSLPPFEKYNGMLRQGAYSFLPPGQDVDIRQHLQQWDATTVTPVLYLDKMGSTNVIILADQNPGTGSQMNVTVDFHIEFASSSQKFPIGVSTIPIGEYQAAVLSLANAGYFYENPTHIGAVAAAVMRGLKFAWPMVKPALIAGARATANHMLTTARGMAVQRLNNKF